MSEIEEEKPPVLEEEKPPVVEENKPPADELESAFDEFANSRSKNNPEDKKEEEEEDIFEKEISDSDNFKVQMFLSLAFALLDGFHVFFYNFISKYKVSKEDIGLDDDDKEGLEIYFKTPQVVALINRLPEWVIGLVHVEYLYFQKFQEFSKKMEALEEQKEEVEEEEEEEEEEETEKVEKPKRPAKKRAKKKRAPKKAPKKTEEKKEEEKKEEEKKE